MDNTLLLVLAALGLAVVMVALVLLASRSARRRREAMRRLREMEALLTEAEDARAG